jgi:hypothetical protein
MLLRRPVSLRQRLITLSALFAALTAVALLASPRSALAFPPAGTDELPVSGQVSVSSRIGQETIPLTGTATIQRGAAQLQGGVEVVPAEITALSLQGDSVTGPITVAESATLASTGELRALQTSSSYPASSYFDVYATVTAPASPGGSITLHNEAALHMVAASNLYTWPPVSATYSATPNPCVPLLPSLPKGICITSLSFTISGGVGGLTRLADVDATAERDFAPSRHDTAAGIGIALAGVLAVGVTGWYVRRLFVHRR